jgi:hypothetical protein
MFILKIDPTPKSNAEIPNAIQTNMNFTNSNPMNTLKFTGSAFESPSDAATILFHCVLLLMVIFGIQEDRRN